MTGERFTVDPAMKAFLHDLRLSPRSVLRRAALPADLFSRDAVRLSPPEYYRLWEALDEEAGDRNLVVEVGSAISVEAFSPPILAALSSPNLAVAAHRIAEFKPLIGPLRIEVRERNGGLSLTYRWPETQRPPDVLVMSELVFWAALARIGTRQHVRPERVSVVEVPAGRSEIEQYFGTRLVKGASNQIVFSARDSRRVFVTENEPMWRFFAPELRRRLSDLEAEASVSDRVRAALLELLPAGASSMAAVTDRLSISSRTLQRQLSNEGTTFQRVLSTTREDLAKYYLLQGSLRTPEIAFLLGYEDTNSFYRAFRGWTGTTPEAARAAEPA